MKESMGFGTSVEVRPFSVPDRVETGTSIAPGTNTENGKKPHKSQKAKAREKKEKRVPDKGHGKQRRKKGRGKR